MSAFLEFDDGVGIACPFYGKVHYQQQLPEFFSRLTYFLVIFHNSLNYLGVMITDCNAQFEY